MKTVRMPIFEDGVETSEYLEVDITFFVSSTSGLRSNQVEVLPCSNKVDPNGLIADALSSTNKSSPWTELMMKAYPIVDDPIQEEVELDFLDRVVHGLPTIPITYKSQSIDVELAKQLRAKEERLLGATEVVLVDAVSPYPEIRNTYGDWRRIPGFEGYTMNPRKIIIDEATDKTIGQEMGGTGAKVNLFDGATGRMKYMSVDFLFKKTFPELSE